MNSSDKQIAVSNIAASTKLRILTLNSSTEENIDHICSLFGEVPAFQEVYTNLSQWLFSKGVTAAVIICESGTHVLLGTDPEDYPCICLMKDEQTLFGAPADSNYDSEDIPKLEEMSLMDYIRNYRLIDTVAVIENNENLLRSVGLRTDTLIDVNVISSATFTTDNPELNT